MRDVIKSEALFEAKPAIIRAFNFSKAYEKGNSKHGDDYLEKHEFRTFLVALRVRFEYFVAFKKIDSGNDQRIDVNEFIAAKSLVEKWVGPIADAKAEFAKIDMNGQGQILFDEFCNWSAHRNLDLDDDNDDNEHSTIKNKQNNLTKEQKI